MAEAGSSLTEDPGEGRRPSRTARIVERLAWTVAGVCLGFWALATVAGHLGRRADRDRFVAALAAASTESTGPAAAVAPDSPDLTLWAAERIRAWRETFTTTPPPPLALLRVPRLGLEVPVLEGVDAWTLNRAVGRIPGTAAPGEEGNAGIAGHRDGWFRVLKDAAPGDALELRTTRGAELYRIERIWVVDPTDVSVLEPTPVRSLTLVTCFPFYHVGPAPRRYIVRAVLEEGPDEPRMGPKSD